MVHGNQGRLFERILMIEFFYGFWITGFLNEVFYLVKASFGHRSHNLYFSVNMQNNLKT
jgi:hypothetical protein